MFIQLPAIDTVIFHGITPASLEITSLEILTSELCYAGFMLMFINWIQISSYDGGSSLLIMCLLVQLHS